MQHRRRTIYPSRGRDVILADSEGNLVLLLPQRRLPFWYLDADTFRGIFGLLEAVAFQFYQIGLLVQYQWHRHLLQ
jgi:hypothetical protein